MSCLCRKKGTAKKKEARWSFVTLIPDKVCVGVHCYLAVLYLEFIFNMALRKSRDGKHQLTL